MVLAQNGINTDLFSEVTAADVDGIPVGYDNSYHDEELIQRAIEAILEAEGVLWLDQAAQVTSGSRRRDYGRPLPNFLRISLRDNIQDAGRRLPGDYISPVDVALRNIEQKLGREQHTHKADNYVDTMGYAACVNDMDIQMKELGFVDGIKAFKRFNMQDYFNLLLVTGDTLQHYLNFVSFSHIMLVSA